MRIKDRIRSLVPSFLLSTDARRRRVLETESAAGHDRAEHNVDRPTPAETSTLAIAAHSAGRAETRHQRKLDRAGQAVLAATATATTVRGKAAIRQADPVREIRSKAFEEAEQASLTDRPDLTQPSIPGWIVLLLEIAVPGVEFFFWHQTWTRDLDRRLPWWSKEQLGAILLALMIPLAGVALAHATGVLLQRIARHRDRASRADWIGAAVFGVLTIVGAVAIFRLVVWRYSSGASLGSIRVPAVPLAWVFVLLLFLVVAVRAFCDSEQHRQHTAVGRVVKSERSEDERDLARIVAADAAVARTWEQGAAQADRCLSDVDQVLATAVVLLNDHWAVTGRNPLRPEVNSASDEAPADASRADATPALTFSLLPDRWEPRLPLRHVRRLLDLLTELRPPELVAAQERLLQLETRLRRIQNWAPIPAAGDGHTQAGDQPQTEPGQPKDESGLPEDESGLPEDETGDEPDDPGAQLSVVPSA